MCTVAGRTAALATAALVVVAASVGFGLLLRGQSPTANSAVPAHTAKDAPIFDVVSIKPTAPGDDKTLIQQPPDGTSFRGTPTRLVLQRAFGVEDDRIVGAPSWVDKNRYDIEAKVAPEDAPKLDKLKGDERNAMLISVLTDRFNLKYHHATRELPMYALVVAKGGPKLAKGEPGPPGGPQAPDPNHPEDPAHEHYKIMAVPGHIEADSVPMYVLADMLTRLHIMGRIVVDKTGLPGNYKFDLRWTPENTLPAWLDSVQSGGLGDTGRAAESIPSSLLTALQEQLGLKLVPEKSAVDVVVIDHIDPPSPN